MAHVEAEELSQGAIQYLHTLYSLAGALKEKVRKIYLALPGAPAKLSSHVLLVRKVLLVSVCVVQLLCRV